MGRFDGADRHGKKCVARAFASGDRPSISDAVLRGQFFPQERQLFPNRCSLLPIYWANRLCMIHGSAGKCCMTTQKTEGFEGDPHGEWAGAEGFTATSIHGYILGIKAE